MDFYKKIIKSKDTASILSEKEYKCVSLQAITNEVVKENNKERLKDLVEEINGHLTDLRLIRDDKDSKNREKCEKLIHQYEECLVKILNKKPSDNVLTVLNQKLEELEYLSNLAIQEDKNEELKKLIEKIERNLEVIKGMPEVKNAKNTEKGEEFLKLVNKYEDLLKKISTHLNAKRRVISEPIPSEISQKFVHGTMQDPETTPPKPNKIGLNEVEEKLKLMRQKRLNRLSTFVDQQAKLSEKRSRENSPKNSDNSNKSLENLSKISESVEIETAIKSIQSPEIVKPLAFRQIAREKPPEQKVLPKVVEKVIKRLEPKVQTSEFQGGNTGVAASFKNTSGKNELSAIVSENKLAINKTVTGTAPLNDWPKTDEKRLGRAFKERESNPQNKIHDNTEYPAENPVPTVRSSFGKGSVTRSFAERQIENAKMQAASEKSKVNLKQSNSARSTPPRTPTQIKKIFNSFNACVLGSSDKKSIEDLPKEFNSPFEQELKTAQLKSTGFDYRLQQFKDKKDNSFNSNTLEVSKTESVKLSDSPQAIPKRIHVPSRDKAELSKNRVFGQTEFDNYSKKVTSSERSVLDENNIGATDKSSNKGKVEKTVSAYYNVVLKRSNEDITSKNNNTKRRLSLDFDTVTVREPEANFANQQPTDLLITVKRDSNTIPNPPDRYSFSTFRTSTDSLKNSHADSVENPLYGIITDDAKIREQPKDSTDYDTVKFNTPIFRTSTDSSKDSSTSIVENPLYGIITADVKMRKHTKETTDNETAKYGTLGKVFKDLITNCNSLEDLLKTGNRKQLRSINYVDKIKELNLILKEVKNNIENTLEIDDATKENKKFTRYLQDIIAIENTIQTFKGLKRDSEYLLIDKQLAKHYVEIDQIIPQSKNERSLKKWLTERLRAANKNLEDKVTKNEDILKTVLEEQVNVIGEKYRLA